MKRKYTFGAIVTSDWTKGSRYQAVGGGMPIFEGENLEVDPPRRLVQNFRALWGEDVKSEGTSAGGVGYSAGWRLLPAQGHTRSNCARAPTINSTAAGR